MQRRNDRILFIVILFIAVIQRGDDLLPKPNGYILMRWGLAGGVVHDC